MSKSKVSWRRWYWEVSTVPYAGLDAQPLEGVPVGQNDALEVGLHQQELGAELVPAALVRTPSLTFQPASSQQLGGVREVLAHLLRRGIDGVLVLAREHSGGILSAISFRISSSRPSGRPLPAGPSCRRSCLPGRTGRRTGLVDPLEVEGEVEGLPHAHVLELADAADQREPCIDCTRWIETPGASRAAVDGVEVEPRGPILGAVLIPVVEVAGLEVLEGRNLVEVVDELELVEVPLAAGSRQVFSPTSL